MLTRLMPDGSVDGSFSDDGQLPTDAVYTALELRSDGRLLVAGYLPFVGGEQDARDIIISRYEPDGAADSSFGTAGTTRTDLAFTDSASAIALGDHGTIMVGGSACSSGLHPGCSGLLARYRRNGRLDQSFFGSGHRGLQFGDFTGVASVVLQRDGRLLAVGTGRRQGNGNPAIVVFRFMRNGARDQSFSTDGLQVTTFGGYSRAAGGFLYPHRTLVVVGNAQYPTTFAVARFELKDGPPDADADGVSDRKDECPASYGTKPSGCPPGAGKND